MAPASKAAVKPRFRLARPADARTLIGLRAAFNASQGYAQDAAKARRVLRELLAKPEAGRIWLIARRGEPVGYVALCFGFSLEWGGRDAFLDELYVEPPARRRGLGRAAVSFALAQAARLGVRAVHLEVERANASARALYRSLGFAGNDRRMLTRRIAGRARRRA
jgi:ribosomal protein S18 acetylase RimI-like enzyme